MEKVIRQGYIQFNGNKVQENVIAEHKLSHYQNIITEMRNDFAINRLKKIWIGGGAVALSGCIEENVSKDTVFDNAKIFYTVGVRKFE
jgi:hypothetical protein